MIFTVRTFQSRFHMFEGFATQAWPSDSTGQRLSTFYQHGLSRCWGVEGVEVNSEHYTLSVTATRIQDLLTELLFWSLQEFYTLKQFKSLLGKLSFVAACVKPGRIFMSCLLNNQRTFPSTRRGLQVCVDMQADIEWWLAFLPLFNGTSFIKPQHWEFDDLQFTTDASMTAGGATCLDECFTWEFPDDIVRTTEHITALELFTIVVTVKF